jgi:hypothetical protein
VVHVAGAEVAIPRFLVFLFPGESEGVKPHGLSAVYTFGFMCWLVHLTVVIYL